MFGFYLYRRTLEDLAEFVVQITTGAGEAADRDVAVGLVADLLAEWPRLPERIAAIRRTLAGRA